MPNDQVETIAPQETESKKWAESVNEALGGAGVKQKPKNSTHPNYEKKMEDYENSVKRRERIVHSLEIFHENGGFALVAHEIEIQEEFRGKVTEAEIGKIIRGHVFENISLHMLAQEGKPINPEASQKLANIVRFPHKFLDEVEETLKSNGIAIEGEVATNLEKARNQLKKHPRNNDAIAFDVVEEDGVKTARITGSYEMKNYLLGDASKVEAVRSQLEDAAKDTREVIRVLNETNLYSAYAMLMDLPELPHVVDIVAENEFTQTVVQPQGMFQGSQELSAADERTDYETRFNSGNTQYGFAYVGVSNSELSIIYEKVDKDIRDYLKQRKSN